MQFDDLGAIPEHTAADINDPTSNDGILTRLTAIEMKLGIDERSPMSSSRTEKNEISALKRRLEHMEVSFKSIGKEVLKHQEAFIPIIEKELTRLTEQIEEGQKKIKLEMTQITDQVANAAASMIEKILRDLSLLTERVSKLEQSQSDLQRSGGFGMASPNGKLRPGHGPGTMGMSFSGSPSLRMFGGLSQSTSTTPGPGSTIGKEDDNLSTHSSETSDLRSSIENMRKSVLLELSQKQNNATTNGSQSGSLTVPLTTMPQRISQNLGSSLQAVYAAAAESAQGAAFGFEGPLQSPQSVTRTGLSSRMSRSCSPGPGPLPINAIPSTSPRERSANSPAPDRWHTMPSPSTSLAVATEPNLSATAPHGGSYRQVSQPPLGVRGEAPSSNPYPRQYSQPSRSSSVSSQHRSKDAPVPRYPGSSGEMPVASGAHAGVRSRFQPTPKKSSSTSV